MVFLFVEQDGTWTVIVTDASGVVTYRQTWRLPMFAVGYLQRQMERGTPFAEVCMPAWEHLVAATEAHLAEGAQLIQQMGG